VSLGADTAVVLGRRILGKPGDRGGRRGMLLALAGRRIA
jgi:predicted house-cleaning NTP pyrophosphatase (Maf/HAM1 superfamily)